MNELMKDCKCDASQFLAMERMDALDWNRYKQHCSLCGAFI